jgi:ATP-dependent Lon protease
MSASIPPPEGPEILPVLPLRNSVLFPASVVPVNVGRARSVRLIEESFGRELEMNKTQREYYLRQQLKAIKEELGEILLRRGLRERPRRARAEAQARQAHARGREGRRKEICAGCARCPPSVAEYTVGRTYLEWIADLPWAKATPDPRHRQRARRPRREPLRPREGEEAHRRVPRGAQAQETT